MNTRKLFIHIGYSKTATTTLQNYLFKVHDQINYLVRPYYNSKLEKVLFEIKSLNKSKFLKERKKIKKKLF